jgi:hypothetical protein
MIESVNGALSSKEQPGIKITASLQDGTPTNTLLEALSL